MELKYKIILVQFFKESMNSLFIYLFKFLLSGTCAFRRERESEKSFSQER